MRNWNKACICIFAYAVQNKIRLVAIVIWNPSSSQAGERSDYSKRPLTEI